MRQDAVVVQEGSEPLVHKAVCRVEDPMRHYLDKAQSRRGVGALRVQVHFSIGRPKVEQRARIHGERAVDAEAALTTARLLACERHLSPMLQQHVECRVFAWAETRNGVRMHNRYVLTEVGGIAAQHGLDSGGAGETDDLTVLSAEQHRARW